ncbi:CATION/H + ANTIPORTER [Salix purpurea]|uniref:DNA helicase n=1 Tax=Salix purpurea TaxID=77065 RepID=A0A9Q0Q4T5_SALPP|nr:CATION/H + ANTIPORTER [Salix purpurea]
MKTNNTIASKVLNDESFAILVLMALFTTFITTPTVLAIYKPARGGSSTSFRKLGDLTTTKDTKDELRILACAHGSGNVPTLISLVESTRSTKNSQLKLYIMHLVELTERSSSIIMVQRVRKNGLPFLNQSLSSEWHDRVIGEFQAYSQYGRVSARTMTSISNLTTMHEDICHVGENKKVALIILPFHLQWRGEGDQAIMDNVGHGWRGVNQRVLKNAPCSVAVLVDRGFGNGSQISEANTNIIRRVCIMFFGGPDDREALELGGRMGEHPAVKVTIVRFIQQEGQEKNHVVLQLSPSERGGVELSYSFSTAIMNPEKEKELDETAMAEFKSKWEGTVEYTENAVNNIVEAVLAIGRSGDYDLIVVGKGRFPSKMVAELAYRQAEHAELGPIGDILASSGHGVVSSVLVIQQHDFSPCKGGSGVEGGAYRSREVSRRVMRAWARLQGMLCDLMRAKATRKDGDRENESESSSSLASRIHFHYVSFDRFREGNRDISIYWFRRCVDAQTGLMGKTLLEFQSNKGDVLPAHKFGTHDVVVMKPNKADLGSPALGQGVVYRLKDSSITVAFDDVPDEGLNSPLRLEKVANEVTYRRMKDALIQLSKGVHRGPAADLIPVLFGERQPTMSKKDVKFTPINSHLDHSQKDAISKALSSKNLFLLHGPPGTGKTTTVVEIILQEVKRGSKILACAASNIAVDNIVERLVPHRVKLVRLGHPARLLPQVLDSALDAQVLRGDNSALANDIRKEMKALNGKLLKTKDKSTRRDIQKELRILSKEEHKRQQLAVKDVIKNADVVLTTLTGAFSYKLNTTSFDLVIIDEAAQALEITCWLALLKGSRCILAGDHLQLPPTIQSVEAEKKGLGRTLFERLTDLYGDEVTSMLTVQYRMHELIMNWSSKELYNSKIKAHPSVAAHTLFDLEGVKRSSSTEPTLLLVDIAGCDMEEKKDEEESTMNEGEAEVAVAHAKRLVQSGVQASDIGIITPYAAQVVLLRILKNNDDKLKDMEISTVDGFQGREKEAIIISMVRSNSKKEVGFLSDHRRMNVAVTRARRQCCLVCDTETVSGDGFLKRLIEHFEEHGEYLSASEYLNE